MKHFWLILLSLFLYFESVSCECARIKRDSSVSFGLRYSNMVFYGELIKFDTIKRTFQYRIIELYKGKYSKDTINGSCNSFCSILPMVEGYWIVYSDLNPDSTISISICSPTYSFQRAEGLLPPPPPPPTTDASICEHDKAYLESRIILLEKRIEGISYWFYDLEKLRKYKKEHTITIVKKEILEIKNILLLLLIITNVALITIILVKPRK